MLKSVYYHHDTTNRYEQWTLERTLLNKMNFVVARNATGKSRFLRAIEGLFQVISGRKNVLIGHWNIEFEFDGEKYEYDVNFDGFSISEMLLIDGVLVLERDGDVAKLMSKLTNNFINVSPPSDSLVMRYRRDKIEFPYFENIFDFAVHTRLFKFGHIHATDFVTDEGSSLKAYGIDDIASILKNEIDESEYSLIKDDINRLGYQVEKLNVENVNGVPKLFIKEKHLVFDVEQRMLSQGMFRAIAMVVYLYFIKNKGKTSLILIDDLAEGLDFERASKLSKYILESFETYNIQIIITSNHNFFLDQVDIKHWILLKKNGNIVRSIGQITHPEEFREFKLSGLAPFDVFSSDFFNKL